MTQPGPSDPLGPGGPAHMPDDRGVDEHLEDAERRLSMEVGNEALEPGRTRLEVAADGRVLVVNVLDGKLTRAVGEVEGQRATRVIDSLGESGMEADMPQRTGIPDEPRYRVELFRGSERIREFELWRSQIEEHRDLEEVFRELEVIVSDASGQAMVL